MSDAPVDLRSDTVTKPDARMRAAMAEAEVGDDVFGEDPTVIRLELTLADLLGHEAALFCPTGTMANQIGLTIHASPGQEFICDEAAHVVRAEMGAAAAYGGLSSRTFHSPNGIIDPEQALAMARPDAGPYQVSTALIAVENTHNFAGGVVQPLDALIRLRDSTRGTLALHLDGARLWNAHVATSVPLATYGRLFDTVSVCLSKGLGSPAGSVLVGSRAAMVEGRMLRKRMGGGLRQAGILAAAGLVALSNIDELNRDHENALILAKACAAVADVVDPTAVETNIVPIDLTPMSSTANSLAQTALEEGVAISVLGPQLARLVTHRDLSDHDVSRAAISLSRSLRRTANQ